MTDWSVSRKLDEVIEQNKEIINLMKMQMIVANPNVDLYNLEQLTHKRIRAAESDKDRISTERAHAAIKQREEHEAQRIKLQEDKEKRIREQKLKEKNDEINSIIDTHNKFTGCGNSSDVMWMPSYGEND